MKSTEMANESNVINMRNQRSSGRPSVAAKMSQLANNAGDISYDSVLRAVGDEIDAEKKSKMLLRTSLLLLFSLLALTAANAGLTFAVVEFAKDTKMDGSVMTTKDGETVKVGSVDFTLANGKMMAVGGASPTPVATAQGMKELDADELLTNASFDITVLDAVESVIVQNEAGSDRSMAVIGYEINDEYTGVTFETASGVTVTVNNDGTTEIEDKENSRSLLRGKKIPKLEAHVDRDVKSFFRIKEIPEEYEDGLYRTKMEIVNLRPARYERQRAADHRSDFMKTILAAAVKEKTRAAPGKASIGKESQKTFDFNESTAQFHEASATWTYAGSGYGSGRRHLAQYNVRGVMPSWSYSLPIPAAYPCHNNDANGYYCEYIDAMSFLGYSDLGVTLNPEGTNYLTDMWGWSDAGSGRDFVIQGTTNSVHFVEVTDPNNPDVVGSYDLDGLDRLNMSWSNPIYNIIADIKTIGNYIYIASWRKNSSITKMDATQLLTASLGTTFVAPTHMSQHIACCYPGLWNINWDKYIAAHNIVGFENMILGFWVSPTWSGGNFSCYPGDAGVMILDASDPSNQVGCIGEVAFAFVPFGTPGALPGGQGVGAPHDGACHNYGSKQICFLAGGYSGKLSAVNVTPIVNNISIALAVDARTTVPGHALTHQIALDAIGGFMIVTDEFDEAWRQNTNPINMRLWGYHYNQASGFALANTIDTGRAYTRDHQGYLYDDFYFLAAVKAGVLIYEITDKPAGIINERGWYDSDPAGPSYSMFGAWSVYAFPYQRCNGNTYYKTAVADMAGLHMIQPQFHTGDKTSCCTNCVPPTFKYSGYGNASGYGSGSGYWSW